jgi:hypothetical protein
LLRIPPTIIPADIFLSEEELVARPKSLLEMVSDARALEWLHIPPPRHDARKHSLREGMEAKN